MLNLPLVYVCAAGDDQGMLVVFFHRITDANKKAMLNVAVKRVGAGGRRIVEVLHGRGPCIAPWQAKGLARGLYL